MSDTIKIFGVPQERDDRDSYRYQASSLWVQAWRTDEGWCVLVMRDTYPRIVEVRVSSLPTLEAAELAWFEYASIEAPRLCSDVCDMMTSWAVRPGAASNV